MDSLKVLLVDDEEDFVTALAERLRLRGMAVQVATDGETALTMVDASPPQVVVLDVLMPGLGGADVLRRIKATHPKIPVLLLTGHGSVQEGTDGLKQGAYDYLVKPIDIEELINKMKDALKSA
jgi:DNA-binding response OmpR family regulator